jgi:hypothetical protein
METEHSRWFVRLMGIVFALFCVACFKSCEDIRYQSSGKTTTARVSSISEHRSRGALTGYDVRYNFVNENTKRAVTGCTLVGSDESAKYTVGQELTIQYFGDDVFTSRIEGTGSHVWLILLVGTTVVTVAMMVILTLRVRPASGGRRPRTR